MPVLLLPPAIPYPDSLFAAGSQICPPINAQAAPFFFDWSLVTAERPGFNVDFSNAPQMPKQICAVYVDNSKSHQGVTLVFPDTGFRLTIKPFVRGYYPVITMATRFYAGIFDPANSANDRTTVYALNYPIGAFEVRSFLNSVPVVLRFDTSAPFASPLVSTEPGFKIPRSLQLNMSGMTAGVAGFAGTFSLLNSGAIVVAEAAVTLAIGEFVDNAVLLQMQWLSEMADVDYTMTWTVDAGALVGTGVGVLNFNYDQAENV